MVTGKEKYPNATSAYVSLGLGGIRGPGGPPPLKPPYASIVAIDLNKGEIAWRIPNGETPEWLKNHPLLKGVNLPNTGQNSHANILVTKSLLFYGEGRGGDKWFRALDKKTGQEIAKLELLAHTNTTPMNFLHNGHQFIVVAIASSDVPAELVAVALPEAPAPENEPGPGR